MAIIFSVAGVGLLLVAAFGYYMLVHRLKKPSVPLQQRRDSDFSDIYSSSAGESFQPQQGGVMMRDMQQVQRSSQPPDQRNSASGNRVEYGRRSFNDNDSVFTTNPLSSSAHRSLTPRGFKDNESVFTTSSLSSSARRLSSPRDQSAAQQFSSPHLVPPPRPTLPSISTIGRKPFNDGSSYAPSPQSMERRHRPNVNL